MSFLPRPSLLFCLVAALALGACASRPAPSRAALQQHPVLHLEFQNGQKVTLQLYGPPNLQNAIVGWAESGIYNGAPVYRQLPGIFVLVGKPRLAGQAFVTGDARPNPSLANNLSPWHVGLVVHADNTVGPELYLQYGPCLVSRCEAPNTVAVGRFLNPAEALGTVERGDRLETVTVDTGNTAR